MKVTATALADVLLIDPQAHTDERGWFMESYNAQRLREAFAGLGAGDPGPFVQDNHSVSRKGVVRGLHYQLPPHAQGKLVRVTQGAAFDVAVDIRRASATFGRWVAVVLSASNRQQMWIPGGFAHGFMALEDDTHLLYKCTHGHVRDSEARIAWNDPGIAIAWPGTSMPPILSSLDLAAPALCAARTF